MPAEQRLSPVWQRDTLTMAHADPRQCLRGGPQRTPIRGAAKLPGLASSFPWPAAGKALWGRACAPKALSPRVAVGSPGRAEMPGAIHDAPCGCGCPSACWPWRFARRTVRLQAAGGHQHCSRVPYLTLVRETPALSPLSICFQLLIPETHVLSIYLEKNE